MTSVYLDTSALVKTLRREAETALLLEHLSGLMSPGITSELSITEVHRISHRFGLPAAAAQERLQELDLVPLTRGQLVTAGLLPDPPQPAGTLLSSADAIHLAAAVAAECTAVLTYDRNQSRAAPSLGLPLLHPGRESGWYR